MQRSTTFSTSTSTRYSSRSIRFLASRIRVFKMGRAAIPCRAASFSSVCKPAGEVMRRHIGVLMAAAALVFCAIGPAAAEPVVVRDALDRTVTLPAPPRRIVTIFASNTEMIAALGLADRIVGIEAFTRYPPEILGKPLVGGRLGFSADAVVQQRPDLVVVTPARQAANQLVDPMERIGVPIIVLQQRNVTEIFANIRLLGHAAGVPERGEEVAARLEARLAGTRERVTDRARPRTIMITGRLGNGL